MGWLPFLSRLWGVKKPQRFPALEGFIRSSLGKGVHEQRILHVLVADGWPRQEVEKILASIRNEQVRMSSSSFSFGDIFRRDKILVAVANGSQRDIHDKKSFRGSVEAVHHIKEEEFLKLKEDIKQEYPKLLEEDIRRVLRLTDELLGQLPDEKVETFVRSLDFEIYKKVMKKVYEPLHSDRKGLEMLERVLLLLEKSVIDGDEARRMLGLPVRDLHIKKIEKRDKEEVLQALKRVRYEKD